MILQRETVPVKHFSLFLHWTAVRLEYKLQLYQQPIYIPNIQKLRNSLVDKFRRQVYRWKKLFAQFKEAADGQLDGFSSDLQQESL